MADDATLQPDSDDGTTISVERRYLLFQLDLENIDDIRSLTGYDPRADQIDPNDGGQPFTYIDPVDYENTRSAIYWRNILNPNYRDSYRTLFDEYKNRLLANIPLTSEEEAQGNKINLRRGDNNQPFIDISELVRSVSGYTVALVGFDNKLSLTLSPAESLADLGSFKAESSIEVDSKKAKRRENLFKHLNISENDILQVRVSRNNGPFEQEFMGFVTTISDERAYGAVDTVSLDVFGLSKLFSTSNIIRQASLSGDQFDPGVDINQPKAPSAFENLFQGKNTRQIFSTLMQQVLSFISPDQITDETVAEIKSRHPDADIKVREEPSDESQPLNLTRFRFDKRFFTESKGFGFQHSLFVLLSYYLMTLVDLDPARDAFSDRLFPRDKLLDSDTRAVLEHGKHLAYNDMVASGFENFFSQMDMPASIFDEIRGATYYDIFESREGTIVCRPPRYNKIEQNIFDLNDTSSRLGREEKRFAIDRPTPENLLRTFRLDQVLDEGAITRNTWVFQGDEEERDFFIRNQDIIDDIDQQRNDMELETRVDTKFMFTYVGPQDFPAGQYTDANLLVKYGLRTQGPIDNPNVQNENLAKLYAPIVLGMKNAKTRTATARVRDHIDYRPGKLYYLEAINSVGYCDSVTIEHGYGGTSQHNLGFSMVRKVVERPIDAILADDHELLNFALCYLADPEEPSDTLGKQSASSYRKKLLAKGRAVLEQMKKVAATRTAQSEELVNEDLSGVEEARKAIIARTPSESQKADQVRAAVDSAAASKARAGLGKLTANEEKEIRARVRDSQRRQSLVNQAKPTVPPQPGGVKVVMYRYVPSIMDLIVDLDERPALSGANKSSKKQDKTLNKSTLAQLKNDALVAEGVFYATEHFFEHNVFRDTRPNRRGISRAFGKAPFEQMETATRDGEKRPDITIPDKPFGFFPVAGALGYRDVAPTALINVNQPKVAGKNQTLAALRTPFFPEQLAETSGNYQFHQLLINTLATVDLRMKYVRSETNSRSSSDTARLVSRFIDGFPQLYSRSSSGGYDLFGTPALPGEYLAAMTNSTVQERTRFVVNQFNLGKYANGAVTGFENLNSIVNFPNALEFVSGTGNAAASKFENEFFVIPGMSENRLRLPYGHLFFISTAGPVGSGGSINTVSNWIRVGGGEYDIRVTAATGSTPTNIEIKAVGPARVAKDVVVETPKPQPGAEPKGEFKPPVEGADFTPPTPANEDTAPVPPPKGPDTVIATPSDGRLYFISPFTDFTIERMLEWSPGGRLIGFRTPRSEAELLDLIDDPAKPETSTPATRAAREQVSASKSTHTDGRAVDLLPAAMILSSGSDLVAKPAAYTRLEKLLEEEGNFIKFSKNSGFPNGGTALLKKAMPAGAWELGWEYLDGSPGGQDARGEALAQASPYTLPFGTFWHLEVPEGTKKTFTSQLKTSQEVAIELEQSKKAREDALKSKVPRLLGVPVTKPPLEA